MPNAPENVFRSLLGSDCVHSPAPSDAVPGVEPQLILEPATEQQLADALRLSNESNFAVIPRSGGTKLGWGNPPARADIILSTTRLNRVLEHAWADLTVTVEAGCTIQTLQDTLAQHGQRLALDPLWPEKATIGGILSTNDSGALRLRFGALRDLIIGVTIALPDGTLARSGGKVVKNVAGYDLPKLVTGALGTLGVITRAVFRLHPRPRNTRSFSISVGTSDQAQKLVLAIQDSKLAHTALQSHFCAETPPSIDILFEGTEAGLDAQSTHLRALCRSAQISEASPNTWNARQELWSLSNSSANAVAQGTSPEAFSFAIAKISILPTDLARAIELLRRAADSSGVRWRSLMYAIGLGGLRFEGSSDNLHRALTSLRANLEKMGGSLVLLHRPAGLPTFDTWGTPGDSLPLMKAVKHRLDPSNTLNPGRFLGGI
jgi:glycolate dehydrogenase FAD-binding subunit